MADGSTVFPHSAAFDIYDILFTEYSISILTHFESIHYCHTTHFHVHWALCPAAVIYISTQGTQSLNSLCITTNPS